MSAGCFRRLFEPVVLGGQSLRTMGPASSPNSRLPKPVSWMVVRSQWTVLSDPSMTPHIKLFFELLALALHQRPGTEGFLDTVTEPWLEVAADVAATQLGHEPDRIELRLGVAVIRGLLIEALAADDPAPATASLDRFLAMWEAWRNRG